MKEEPVGLTFGAVFDISASRGFSFFVPSFYFGKERKEKNLQRTKIRGDLEEMRVKILPKGEIYHDPQRICSIMKGVIIMECCECLFIDEGSFFFITFSMEDMMMS